MREFLSSFCRNLFSDALRTGEARVLSINASRYSELAAAAESAEGKPEQSRARGGSLFQTIEQLNTVAGEEVASATASVKSRLGRPFLSVAGAVAGVDTYNATEKIVNQKLNELGRQRMMVAETELGKRELESVGALGNCTTMTKLGTHFLTQKAAACNAVKTFLNQKVSDASTRLSQANALKTVDRGLIKKSIARLQQKVQAVDRISSDIERKLKRASSGELTNRVNSAVQYFESTFAAHEPDLVGSAADLLREFAEGNPARLEQAIGRVAGRAWPQNTVQQERQRQAMLKVAKDMTVRGSYWKALKWTLTTIGTGVVPYPAYNWFRMGTISKTQFLKAEVSDVFKSEALKRIETLKETKKMKTVTERMGYIKFLPVGATFSVEHGGKMVPVSVLKNNGAVCVAKRKDNAETTYCLDVLGQKPHSTPVPGEEIPEAEFPTVVKRKGAKNELGRVVANTTASDSLLTITTPSPAA